jgi:hypothetical protein
MLTSTMGFSSQPNAVYLYAKNVGTAARGFVAALLAIKPEIENAPAVVAEHAAPVGDELSLFRLYRMAMASSYDSVSPQLANELRLIAARD